jgi:hypothetical protein
VAEIEDPFLVDLAAGSVDPFLRAQIWGRWGYRKIDFPYVQPALSNAQRPVRHLLLAAKPIDGTHGDAIPGARVVSILHAYLRWAMRIATPETNAEYRAMRIYLSGIDGVRLIGLERYVGRDPDSAVVVDEVGADGGDLDAVLAVYAESFPPGATALEPLALRQAVLACERAGEARYHLWAIRARLGDRVDGMASFFSLRGVGFGGYIALRPMLRGRGYLRLIVARIEEQMRRDATGARGWLIECAPGSAVLHAFRRIGFHEIMLDYRQPPLRDRESTAEATVPLSLSYKEFGPGYAVPALTRAELRTALLSIYRVVYGIGAAEQSPSLQALEAQMNAWPGDAVEWRREKWAPWRRSTYPEK